MKILTPPLPLPYKGGECLRSSFRRGWRQPLPSPTREGRAYGVPSAEDGGSRSPPLQGRGVPTEFLPQRMAAAAPLPCRGGAGGGVSNIKKRVQSSERPSFATAQLRKINKSSKKESSALGLFVRGPRTKSSRTADKEFAHRAFFRLMRLRKPRRGGGVQPGGRSPEKRCRPRCRLRCRFWCSFFLLTRRVSMLVQEK